MIHPSDKMFSSVILFELVVIVERVENYMFN